MEEAAFGIKRGGGADPNAHTYFVPIFSVKIHFNISCYNWHSVNTPIHIFCYCKETTNHKYLKI